MLRYRNTLPPGLALAPTQAHLDVERAHHTQQLEQDQGAEGHQRHTQQQHQEELLGVLPYWDVQYQLPVLEPLLSRLAPQQPGPAPAGGQALQRAGRQQVEGVQGGNRKELQGGGGKAEACARERQ